MTGERRINPRSLVASRQLMDMMEVVKMVDEYEAGGTVA